MASLRRRSQRCHSSVFTRAWGSRATGSMPGLTWNAGCCAACWDAALAALPGAAGAPAAASAAAASPAAAAALPSGTGSSHSACTIAATATISSTICSACKWKRKQRPREEASKAEQRALASTAATTCDRTQADAPAVHAAHTRRCQQPLQQGAPAAQGQTAPRLSPLVSPFRVPPWHIVHTALQSPAAPGLHPPAWPPASDQTLSALQQRGGSGAGVRLQGVTGALNGKGTPEAQAPGQGRQRRCSGGRPSEERPAPVAPGASHSTRCDCAHAAGSQPNTHWAAAAGQGTPGGPDPLPHPAPGGGAPAQ